MIEVVVPLQEHEGSHCPFCAGVVQLQTSRMPDGTVITFFYCINTQCLAVVSFKEADRQTSIDCFDRRVK